MLAYSHVLCFETIHLNGRNRRVDAKIRRLIKTRLQILFLLKIAMIIQYKNLWINFQSLILAPRNRVRMAAPVVRKTARKQRILPLNVFANRDSLERRANHANQVSTPPRRLRTKLQIRVTLTLVSITEPAQPQRVSHLSTVTALQDLQENYAILVFFSSLFIPYIKFVGKKLFQ